MWSLVEAFPAALSGVHLWHAREAPIPSRVDCHYHSLPTMVACLQGVARVIGGHAGHLDLHAGEVLVIAPGVWHANQALRPGSVAFEQGFLATCSDAKLHDHERVLMSRLPRQPCLLLMKRIIDLGAGPKAAKARRIACVQLFTQILDETIEPLAPPHPAVQRMIGVLWRRLHEPITTNDLFRASGISRSQAYLLFTAHFGASIKREMLRLRLDLAQELLKEGFAVGEVATRCGFASRANFTRSFTRVVGAPPRTLRRVHPS